MKTKVVNIYPTRPITGVNPPIRSTVKKVTKPIEDIRQCLIERAAVEEICGGGVIRLGMHNYDKDNSGVKEGKYKSGTIYYKPEFKTPGTLSPTVNPSKELGQSMYNDKQQGIYDRAYAEAIGNRDLTSMSRKDRRRIERSAKDYAAKAVAEAEKKSFNGGMVKENTAAEKVGDTTEIASSEETVIETNDIENIINTDNKPEVNSEVE